MNGKILIDTMSPANNYLNNSSHKNFIREKWVEFIQEVVTHDDEIGIITFPAEEMQDLCLFKEKGLIDWNETETGAYHITKGKVVCFEKSHRIFSQLSSKLVNVVLESEIGIYLRTNYNKIESGIVTPKKIKVFPVDAINLDYDGRLAKCKVPIDDKIDLIFKFQRIHKRNFSLFLTWPSTEEDDEEEYKTLLKTTIQNNLSDPSAQNFKRLFEEKFNSIEDLDYDNLSLVGLTKLVLKKASNSFYKLNRHELYTYGENGRKKMYSVLYNFEHRESSAENLIYSQDVDKALAEITSL